VDETKVTIQVNLLHERWTFLLHWQWRESKTAAADWSCNRWERRRTEV